VSAIRVSSVAALLLLVTYHLLRLAAAQCTGPQCDDAYLPLSLLVPIAVLVVAAVAGSLASGDARAHARSWFGVVFTATLVSLIGPLLAVLIFRDQPDTVVVVSTVFFLPAPAAALAYSFRSSPSRVP
jgi:hypothetical protein